MIIWSIICVLFVAAVAVIIAIKLLPYKIRAFVIGKSNRMPFFNMVNISLGGSISPKHIPVRNFARTLLFIWLLSNLVLRNAYQGKLFDILRSNQRTHPLFTFDQLYGSTIKLHVYASLYDHVLEFVPAHR